MSASLISGEQVVNSVHGERQDHAATAATASSESRFDFVELFSGIGGFRIALEAAGGRCVLACEYCKFAKAAYLRRWPNGPNPVGDIRKIAAAQVPPHDVLAAGFPCQSFSNAGKGLLFEDERGKLFYELVRLARECRPRALLLENVRGLLTRPGALNEVRRALASAGYPEVRVKLLDASLLLPQRRRRVFLIAFRESAPRRAFAWPVIPQLRRTAEDVLEYSPHACSPPAADLTLPVDKWRKVEASAYYQRFPSARLLAAGALSQTLQTSYRSGYLLYSQFVPQGLPASASIASCGPAAHADPWLSDPLALPACSRESPPPPPRFFSPRECARLMGFPESFPLSTGAGVDYRLLGNAVCPPLVGALGVAVAKALEAASGQEASTVPSTDSVRCRRSGLRCLVQEGAAFPEEPPAVDDTDHSSADETVGEDDSPEALNCEAISVALQLALEAVAAERLPSECWLPAMALSTLGLRPEEADKAESQRRLPSVLNTEAAGGAYHTPVDSTTVGPFPLPLVLRAAREHVRLQGSAERRRVPRRYGRPAQTLPAPTHEMKAYIAAACMRRYTLLVSVSGGKT